MRPSTGMASSTTVSPEWVGRGQRFENEASLAKAAANVEIESQDEVHTGAVCTTNVDRFAEFGFAHVIAPHVLRIHDAIERFRLARRHGISQHTLDFALQTIRCRGGQNPGMGNSPNMDLPFEVATLQSSGVLQTFRGTPCAANPKPPDQGWQK
jgi:hypothetical protein